jgi:hypothetical protein
MAFIRSRTLSKALHVKLELVQDHILYLYSAELDTAPENSVKSDNIKINQEALT